jgi:EAL domain-containing protein (putative c-di-GMP-specific phosphodiesterase class I)
LGVQWEHKQSEGVITLVENDKLSGELQVALELGQITAHYQPQVDVATGRIVAAEALARWTHPTLGAVSPTVFIPLAETSELIHSLGIFMLEQAVAALTRWASEGFVIGVSVNVSPTQLTRSGFYDRLESELTGLSLPAGSLTIEITENQPLFDSAVSIQRLSRLRRRGLGVSIDDYGVGHSSLAQLDRLPATELKIDQSLVQDDSAESLALISAVIELAHWRGMRVVAEGVETGEQFQRISELDCDRAQGFLLGRPTRREWLEELVEAQS